MTLYDAHNHLHDERFLGNQAALVAACDEVGVRRMVVNGSCEEDWPAVAELARRFPRSIIPAFGLHPWYVHQRTPAWLDTLRRHLDQTPGAVVGEIGLDRWILDCPPAAREAVAVGLAELSAASIGEQEEVFALQLALAAERQVAASIHCLQAWGRLQDQLRTGPRPQCGFLLHSYGGALDLVVPLARLGAYFSFPGYFLHARKARQREVFRSIPRDRLLIETDAPDQRLPPSPEWLGAPAPGEDSDRDSSPMNWHPRSLAGADGRPLNHPANLVWVYSGLASWLGEPMESLAMRVGVAFEGLFGSRASGG